MLCAASFLFQDREVVMDEQRERWVALHHRLLKRRRSGAFVVSVAKALIANRFFSKAIALPWCCIATAAAIPLSLAGVGGTFVHGVDEAAHFFLLAAFFIHARNAWKNWPQKKARAFFWVILTLACILFHLSPLHDMWLGE
jgi:hypothetical protein